MHHAELRNRHVNVALLRAALGAGHQRHVRPTLDFTEQQVLPIEPGQARRIG